MIANVCGCSNDALDIKIKYHSKDINDVAKIRVGDWIDLRSAEYVEMKMFDFKFISLGISMEIPEGYEMLLAPRGSTFKNFGIIQPNSPGVIDNSYCGDDDIIKMPALAMRDTIININDRICQFRLLPNQKTLNFIVVDSLSNSNRGGFGSSGKN